MYFKTCALTFGAALVLGASAHAAVITLDFEGIGDQVPVRDYYNGGGGEDFGIDFSDNALAVLDRDAGGTGNFANEPTPDTILFFLTGSAATLNAVDGFETGFSFFYTATNNPGSIQVYDGLDATGNVLAELALPTLPEGPGDPNGGLGDPRGSFGNFAPIGIAFDGVARSIDFAGTINQIGFDNITFGSADPGTEGGMNPPLEPTDPTGPQVVPLPASLPFLLAGLAGLGLFRRKG